MRSCVTCSHRIESHCDGEYCSACFNGKLWEPNPDKTINDLFEKFGKEYVIGYLVCTIHILMKKEECHELMHYLQEYERITGEAISMDDIVV